MSTFHAVVWIDHAQAHVLMFDREHVQAERIKSRNTHSHQGKHADTKSYFAAISHELAGVHEVLLTGPGTARTEFRHWCEEHAKGLRTRHHRQCGQRPPHRSTAGRHGPSVLCEV